MQKVAVSFGGSVAALLDRINPGGWIADVAAVEGGEIGVITHPSAAIPRVQGLAGIQRFENGDIAAWSGLPLPVPRLANAGELRQKVSSLDGAFTLVTWSAADRSLEVAGDCLGLLPLYRQRGVADLVVATDARAFPYEPDPAGWGANLAVGNCIGRHVLNASAEKLGPSEILHRSADATVTSRRHFQWPGEGKPTASGELVAALQANIQDWLDVYPDAVLMMSGGYDSRLTLAILDRLGVKPRARVMRHEFINGNTDALIAHRAARIAGIVAEDCAHDPGYYSSPLYASYVQASEAGTSTLNLFIAQIVQFVEPGVPVWDGLITGNALNPRQQTRRGTFDDLARQWVKLDAAGWSLFRADKRDEMRAAFETLYAESKDGFEDTQQGVWSWTIEQRMRNRGVMNSIMPINNQSLAFMPGMSRDFWTLSARVPHELKITSACMQTIFAENFPKFARLPFDSGASIETALPAPFEKAWYLARIRLAERLALRPKLASFLGVPPDLKPRPAVLDLPALYEEDDDWLDMELVRGLAREGHPTDLHRRLFHWRAARWMHDGRLPAIMKSML